MSLVDLLLSFRGRVGRLTFALCWSLLSGITLSLLPLNAITWTDDQWLVAALFAYMHLAVAAKRAHDLDRSAWWLLRGIVAPFGGLIVAGVGVILVMQSELSVGLLLILVALPLSSVGLLQTSQLLLTEGTIGPNGFGHPPRLAQTLFSDSAEPGTSGMEGVSPAAPVAAPALPVAIRHSTVSGRHPAAFGRRASKLA